MGSPLSLSRGSSVGRRACKPVVLEEMEDMLCLWSCEQSEAAGPAREKMGLGPLRVWLAPASMKANSGRGSHQLGEICLVVAGSQRIAAIQPSLIFCRGFKKSYSILSEG